MIGATEVERPRRQSASQTNGDTRPGAGDSTGQQPTQLALENQMTEKRSGKPTLRWLFEAALGIAALEALLWLLRRGTIMF